MLKFPPEKQELYAIESKQIKDVSSIHRSYKSLSHQNQLEHTIIKVHLGGIRLILPPREKKPKGRNQDSQTKNCLTSNYKLEHHF